MIISARNVSDTSIRLSWKPPPIDSVNGEHLGYRISYRKHYQDMSRTGEDVRRVTIRDPDARVHDLKVLETFKYVQVIVLLSCGSLQRLNPYTKYVISIQVLNPEGLGPAATVHASTDEGGKRQDGYYC